jgi:hypothetical protein
MRKKRPFDGFIGWIISRRYSRLGFIFIFKAVFMFKFSNLYAQPVYLWGAHASRSLHVSVSKVLSGTWGTARAAQRGARPGEHFSPERGGPPELLSGERVPGSMGLYWCSSRSKSRRGSRRRGLPKDIPAEHINLKI